MTLSLVVATVAVLLGWMAVAVHRRRPVGVILLAALVAAPLFLKVGPSVFELGDAVVPRGGGQTFPAGLLAVALFAGLAFVLPLSQGRLRVPASPLLVPLVLFVLVNLVALLIGLLQEPRVENVLFFVQTVVPVTCFFIGLACVDRATTARRLLLACAVPIAVAGFAAVVTDVARDGLGQVLADGVSGYAGPLPLYGALDYFPLALAVAYGLLLSLALDPDRLAARLVLGGMAAGVLVTLLFFRSKGAFLTAAAMTVVQIAVMALEPARRRQAFGLAVGVLTGAVAIALLAPTASTVRNLQEFVSTEAGDDSSTARIRNVEHAVGVLGDSPLIGMAYVAAAPDFTGVQRIANPHNQYLTYALRAGLPALALFAWLLLVEVTGLFQVLRGVGAADVQSLGRAVFGVLIGVAGVSNLLQDNFTQPYSGCLLWLLLGVGAAIGGGRVQPIVRRPTGAAA